MKITYRWMKEFLTFDITAQELVDRLTMIGHEVEEVIDLGLMGNPIRTARILKVEKHPQADSLTLCTVDDGTGENLTVVCGAPNVVEGGIAVLARVGAKLPNGLEIKRAKIRGVASEGMLCALDELGLGSDHSGILLLDPETEIGQGYDVIIEVSITPNRPDCLSIMGLARDVAAAYSQKIYARPNRIRESYVLADSKAQVHVLIPEHCPRYAARIITGIKIEPSPQWLQLKLLAVGLRPINNVVDATNFALIERGHPMHAFDYDKLADHRIIVRMAEIGEKLKLINGTEIELAPGEDMVIADAHRPVALAGIMGGSETEVSDETTNLLLESAYFNPSTIRRSSKRHHLSSDASYRFERGADQRGVTDALDYATALIVKLGEAEVAKGVLDTNPKRPQRKTIMLRADRASRVLGMEIPRTVLADILTALQFEILRIDHDSMILTVPTYRVDIEREEDLYEEIARIHGFEKVPVTMPTMTASARPLLPTIALQRLAQDRLVGMGFDEAIHISFANREQLEEMGLNCEDSLQVINPISQDMATLRPDLSTSMVGTLLYNQNHGNMDLKLFEVGSTFHMGDMASPYSEKTYLALAMMGALNEGSWREQPQEVTYSDLKGVVEALITSLGVSDVRFVNGGPQFLHSGRCARIMMGDTEIGWLGEISPALKAKMGLRQRAQLAELFLDLIQEKASVVREYREIPRFPGMERDLALVLDEAIPASRIEEIIRKSAGELLVSLRLFDYYSGSQIPEGKKSLAYRAQYRHPDRTLTDAEIDEIQTRILKTLTKETQAVLR